MKDLIYYAQSIPPPPEGFYYTLFVVLGGAILWVIKDYLNKTDATLKQLVDTVTKLDKIIGVHELKHEQHEKNIEELKDRRHLYNGKDE